MSDRSSILHPDYWNSTFQHLDDMPQNRVLYRDSGKWRIETEDRETVLYSQGVNESFSEFIERAYNAENIYNNTGPYRANGNIVLRRMGEGWMIVWHGLDDQASAIAVLLNAAFAAGAASKEPDPSKVTRIEVIDETGRGYVNMKAQGCEVQFQDNGKTLKVFTTGSANTPPDPDAHLTDEAYLQAKQERVKDAGAWTAEDLKDFEG